MGPGQFKDSKFRLPGEHTQLCVRLTPRGSQGQCLLPHLLEGKTPPNPSFFLLWDLQESGPKPAKGWVVLTTRLYS